jgi:hypothetical protein
MVIVRPANASSANNPSIGVSGVPTSITATTGLVSGKSPQRRWSASQRGALIFVPVMWKPVTKPHGPQFSSLASAGEMTVRPPAVSSWNSHCRPPASTRAATPLR